MSRIWAWAIANLRHTAFGLIPELHMPQQGLGHVQVLKHSLQFQHIKGDTKQKLILLSISMHHNLTHSCLRITVSNGIHT